MKYRVKFECYHHNTGSADNHYYTGYEDFDTMSLANKFKEDLIEQRVNEQNYELNKITYAEFTKWKESFGDKYYSVEDGFVSFSNWGNWPKIVGFEPESEFELQ